MAEKREKIVIFSGAGVSADSGLKTFRDHNGLWENHDITEVATPEAWKKNPELVLRFYNLRRKQLFASKPNPAHFAIAELEKHFEVIVITQNIDDFHEQAGSSEVIHLHGELKKVQSEKFSDLVYNFEKQEIEMGDLCEKGHQLRPHVVWFGEPVPMMDVAYQKAKDADRLIVIGTSLNVYPAANIVNYVPNGIPSYLIDPSTPDFSFPEHWTIINQTAAEGMPELAKKLTNKK